MWDNVNNKHSIFTGIRVFRAHFFAVKLSMPSLTADQSELAPDTLAWLGFPPSSFGDCRLLRFDTDLSLCGQVAEDLPKVAEDLPKVAEDLPKVAED